MKAPLRPADAFQPVAIASEQVAKIVTTLRRDIVSGVIPSRAQLGQEALAERFGVSRMPIREAIQHLTRMGFVTIESNKRAHVAETSESDFRDIWQMRLALEPLAMSGAMEHLTNAHIDSAEVIALRMRDADPYDFGRMNLAFHMMLYRPCKRTRLLEQIETLFNAADRYLCIAKAPEGLRETSNREHEQLLEACRRRDAKAAEACLQDHVGGAMQSLVIQF